MRVLAVLLLAVWILIPFAIPITILMLGVQKLVDRHRNPK